jgi:hypothetical protein
MPTALPGVGLAETLCTEFVFALHAQAHCKSFVALHAEQILRLWSVVTLLAEQLVED